MKTIVALLLLLTAAPLAAQVQITEAELTPDVAASVIALYNRTETNRLSGDSRVAAGTEVNGDVAVLEGRVTIAGHIRGALTVINGDAAFEPGARVDGSVTLVGGAIEGVENLTATSVTLYRERLKYELRDGTLLLVREVRADELSAGREFAFGRTDLLISAHGGYNRTEGLPIHFAPRLTLGHSNPTRFEGLYVFRTAAAFEFDEEDFGYGLGVEQFLGGKRAARAGFRWSREVLPIETWGLSDRENSIAGFVIHRDYRDHFEREGWTAYLASGRRGLPLTWRAEFTNYRYRSVPLRDPFSLLYNDDGWRDEVAIPGVRLHAVRVQGEYDTRNDDRDPAAGWLVRGDVELAVSLRSGDASSFSDSYRYGLIDARRYARLSPSSRMSLRAIAAGSINGDALPAYRQQSLGGEGSLPGYELYQYDCGGHDFQISGSTHVPYYGCDRLLLFQVEYQSSFGRLSRVGRQIGRDFGLLDNIKWVVFFNTGRAWTENDARGIRGNGTDDFVADAGFGLRFGQLGIYWAVPLSAHRGGVNFFVRAGPRI